MRATLSGAAWPWPAASCSPASSRVGPSGAPPGRRMKPPILSAQIALSAGTYLVAGGRPVHLTEYSIDQTEVSNRQYSVFLRSLEKNPAQSRVYDHPEQPAGWSHVPPGWKGCRPVATAAGSGLDWESLPVSGVAWWDAFAFARWSGRGLPSAEEWEAAARGARGFLYPWGDESKNGGARTQETLGPAAPPGPTAVRSQKDRSPSGTLGMAGNVAEWTDSAPGREVRTVKGGSFLTPLESLDSTSAYPCESRLPQLGFRTRSRKD
jgi:formylglycine-generating enzyme required for sulfatase activity